MMEKLIALMLDSAPDCMQSERFINGEVSMEVLAIIPARGGSKGIPRKNIRLVADKPLLAHSIEHARHARSVTRVVVSTDDSQIAQVAQAYGAEVVDRPAELSGDTASSESALIHVLETLHASEGYTPDLVVFLQATSPVRKPTDIDHALEQLLQQEADSLLSVIAHHRFVWRKDAHEAGLPMNYDPRHRPRRQDLIPEYAESGSIYILKPSVLAQYQSRLGGKIALYEMDYWAGFDIDTEEDLALCDWIIRQQLG